MVEEVSCRDGHSLTARAPGDPERTSVAAGGGVALVVRAMGRFKEDDKLQVRSAGFSLSLSTILDHARRVHRCVISSVWPFRFLAPNEPGGQCRLEAVMLHLHFNWFDQPG